MKRKNLFAILLIIGFQYGSYACDLCKKNQPKMLENITHGTGPTGTIDYIITWSAVAIVSFTLFYSVKYLIKPKETNPEHVKNIVLKKDF